MDKIRFVDIENFIQLSGPLFEAVQNSSIFSDSKTFVDSVPRSSPKKILQNFEAEKEQTDFDLEAFVRKHFQIPKEGTATKLESVDSMWPHIERLWEQLSRQPDEDISEHSTLIPLPHPYIVPGGRFREIYYWDTYFTAEGLAASGHWDMVENLIQNFAHLIELAGHVPNGNRYYYVSRSQPPFFVFLVDLLISKKGEEIINKFLPALKKEYQFWMEGRRAISDGQAYRRIVNKHGHVLNRYWDDRPLPREESWREDLEIARDLDPPKKKKRYRDLRAGAESGWDYSSRWLGDKRSLDTICTTNILAADLNALLYFLELRLGQYCKGNEAKKYYLLAQERRQAYNEFFWDDDQGYYFDYNWQERKQTDAWSLVGVYPLFVQLASDAQAEAVAKVLKKKFLKEGGLVTSLHETGQQWDYPNGWAPLQWMAVKGLMNYGHDELARTIAERWLSLNESVFNRTGKMMEKYNVCDLSLEAGGGEYPLQDGFGWTNGVAVALQELVNG